jgi:hypothetical protein
MEFVVFIAIMVLAGVLPFTELLGWIVGDPLMFFLYVAFIGALIFSALCFFAAWGEKQD